MQLFRYPQTMRTFWASKQFFLMSKNKFDVQNKFWTSTHLFGRPAIFLDVQTFLWTFNFFLDVQTFCWTSKNCLRFANPAEADWRLEARQMENLHLGIAWNGMEWNGNGTEWNGTQWMECNGMERNAWNAMEWKGMEWNFQANVMIFEKKLKTLNGCLPLKHSSDRCETLGKRVSDDSQHFNF